jgi:hypothetical protein
MSIGNPKLSFEASELDQQNNNQINSVAMTPFQNFFN